MIGEVDRPRLDELYRIRVSHCPFCGGMGKVKKRFASFNYGYAVYVECQQCGATTPEVYISPSILFDAYRIQEVVDIWEMRQRNLPKTEPIRVQNDVNDLSLIETSPCPCCGGRGMVKSSILNPRSEASIYVECLQCNIKTPEILIGDKPHCVPYKRKQIQRVMDIWEKRCS